jgi:hypothetical protein
MLAIYALTSFRATASKICLASAKKGCHAKTKSRLTSVSSKMRVIYISPKDARKSLPELLLWSSADFPFSNCPRDFERLPFFHQPKVFQLLSRSFVRYDFLFFWRFHAVPTAEA